MNQLRDARLSLMMFLNYVIWGAWYVTLGTYLTATLKFSGTEAGAVFGTTALASMISPFFVGMFADRFFATERMLASLHLIGAVLLFAVTKTTTFGSVYALMLIYCLCYFPTIALTNSLTLRNIHNAGKEFPLIRVFGTLGWIVIGLIVGNLQVEKTATQFLIASGMSLVMSVYCLTLPHTPPAGKGQKITARELLGLDALVMLKDRSFLVFVIASVLFCIPLTFYFVFTNAFLNVAGVANAASKMTIGQASEVGVMLAMPLIYRRFNLKAILLLGLLSWSVRYVLLATGNAGSAMWMFYLAIALHGVCYDFFVMTGQLYTDQEAPDHLRSTAQGLLTFLTYGVGMFLGSNLSGVVVDYFTRDNVTDWSSFWYISAAGSFAILLFVLLFFRSSKKIETHKSDHVAA